MIRFMLGFILVLGGVGGIEHNTETLLPLDSLCVIIVGFLLMFWFIIELEENDYDY